MIRDGIVKDAHSMTWEEYATMHKGQWGYSAGKYGCNGQLFIDYKTGDLYTNIGRDNWIN